MTTTTKAMALAAALLVPLFAASVFATTVSDFGAGGAATNVVTTAPGGSGASPATITYTESTWNSGTQDWCSGVDNDGPGNAAPLVPPSDASSCDSDSPTTSTQLVGSGEATGLVGLLGWTCVNNANVCHGGFGFFADTASGDGRFGGDYNNATKVVITADPPQRLVFQVGYRHTQTGVVSFTGISAITCVGNGVGANPPPYIITVGGGGFTDPLAGNTINSVNAGKATGDPLCPGSNGQAASTVTGTWTYEASVDDSAVNTSISLIASGNTCTVTFSNSGSIAAGRFGQVTSQILSGGPSASSPSSLTHSGAYGPIPSGTTVTAVTSAWAIGASYKYEAANVVTCV